MKSVSKRAILSANFVGVSANRRCFFGYRDDRIALLKEFDLFVLPSKSEGIPRCVMEAMAAMVPVVATNIPGCRDLIFHSSTGLLFEPGDYLELSKAIIMISKNRDYAEKMAENALTLIKKRFHPRRMAAEYSSLFRSLIKGN